MNEGEMLYIDGDWEAGERYETLYSPYDQEELARIPLATKAQVKRAIDSATMRHVR